MTASELKAYFLAEYDVATSLAAPGWEDDEISSFLNIAQDSIVTELHKIKDYSLLGELINTTSSISTFTHPYDLLNAICFTLSDVIPLEANSFFYYIDSRTKLTRTNPTITESWIPNQLIQRENANKFYVSRFNTPWFRNPKIYIESLDNGDDIVPRFTILVDAYTDISTPLVELTYLKRPARINITGNTTTDLNESLHQTIVQVAVEQVVKAGKIAKIANQ